MNQNVNKISAEEWHHNQNNIVIPKAKMNELVLNFFIVEGYCDAAIEFSKEAGIYLSNKELDKIIERIEIKQYILNGEIDLALEKVSLCNNKQILFKLTMQLILHKIQLQISSKINLILLIKLKRPCLYQHTKILIIVLQVI